MTEDIKRVRLCGFGGQGVILAGTILGYAGIKDGKMVAGSSSYGAAARGGACRSDIVISGKTISFPHVIEVNILIAMYQRAYESYLESVDKANGIVIYDRQLVEPAGVKELRQIGIPATSMAIKKLKNRQVANIIMLGAAIALTNLVSRESLISTIGENVKGRFKSLNLKAAELGFTLGEAEK